MVIGIALLYCGAFVSVRRSRSRRQATGLNVAGGTEETTAADATAAFAITRGVGGFLTPEWFAGQARKAVLAYYGCVGLIIVLLVGGRVY